MTDKTKKKNSILIKLKEEIKGIIEETLEENESDLKVINNLIYIQQQQL